MKIYVVFATPDSLLICIISFARETWLKVSCQLSVTYEYTVVDLQQSHVTHQNLRDITDIIHISA